MGKPNKTKLHSFSGTIVWNLALQIVFLRWQITGRHFGIFSNSRKDLFTTNWSFLLPIGLLPNLF